MPANLRKAHAALANSSGPHFASDRDRVEQLFGRYEALASPLARLGAARNRHTTRHVARASSRD